MKRIVLVLAVFWAAFSLGVQSQVTIGAESDPHSGAVLDLSHASGINGLGFLLPRVSLNDVNVWQIDGNAANGTGMVVYNTNPDVVDGNGKGIYVWDGSAWSSVKSSVVADVKVTGFDVNPSTSEVDILVGSSQSFSVSNFIPVYASYQGVTWTISSGQGFANISASTMTSCTVQGLSVGDATLTIRSLDESCTKTVTLHVKVCTAAPAVPTGITFSKTSGIKLNEVITATATPEVTTGGAIPTQYNWTPGSNFEIQGDATGRMVSLKAIASFTGNGGIKVSAQNTCGASADYTNATSLTVLNCEGAPATPGTIAISPTSVAAGENFTASISTVSGATSYTWNTPSTLSIVSGQGTTSVTYKTSSQTTIAAGAITVYATNACGNSSAKPSGTAVTVNAPAGYTVTNGVFSGPPTSSEIEEGTTLAQLINSYGFAATTQSLLLGQSDLGQPHTWASAKSACEAKGTGWRLPNIAELGNLQANRGAYGLSQDLYWSSTERDGSRAWGWYYLGSGTHWNGKTGSYYAVRCVQSL